MSEKVVIAVDVLGGDFGPQVVLPGIEQALAEDENLEVIACGPKDVVVPFAQAHDRVRAQETTEEITMDEHPAQAVRKKKDSSLVVGNRLVSEGVAGGFFSAGSTGACLAVRRCAPFYLHLLSLWLCAMWVLMQIANPRI